MKSIFSFLTLFLMLVPGPVSPFPFALQTSTITLTADEVSGANDIEAAFHAVTAEGKHPGVVILDGSKGPFVFTHIDRAINFFFSDLTLQGRNNAILPNTDGIYLDGDFVDNIVIEGLTMVCSGDCVGAAPSVYNNVTIRNNIFRSGAMGIGMGDVRYLTISNNVISAGGFAVHLVRSVAAEVSHNQLHGEIGVVLEGAVLSSIHDNSFSGAQHGFWLSARAFRNEIYNNSMTAIRNSGAVLDAGVRENVLSDNDMICLNPAECKPVLAAPETLETNTIDGEAVRAETQNTGVVRITAEEVNGAKDIENAISLATKGGEIPGIVILDGSFGPFTFSEADRSINIFVSNLTLKGINHAAITGCDDGIFFDRGEHIRIEGISFRCFGDGVEANNPHEDVVLIHNQFFARMSGIRVSNNSIRWTITGNIIQASGTAVEFHSVHESEVSGNHLSGETGILLVGSEANRIENNTIYAEESGIQITQEAWKNYIHNNDILGVLYTGIGFEADVIHNAVIDNRVVCASAELCSPIRMTAEIESVNYVFGNRP